MSVWLSIFSKYQYNLNIDIIQKFYIHYILILMITLFYVCVVKQNKTKNSNESLTESCYFLWRCYKWYSVYIVHVFDIFLSGSF
jgi:hypothetical protein